MRILRIHNYYQQRGGEDIVFEAEVRLLMEQGEDVRALTFANDQIAVNRSPLSSLHLAASTVWSQTGRQRIAAEVAGFCPDIVHFDNTFPLISPAAYSIARSMGAAVVQTLHNFRLLCPNGLFYRDSRVCEDCLGKTPPLSGVVHACYRNSRSQTAVVAAMLTVHRIRRTWSNDVDRYIALTEFARQKFIEGSLPGDRIMVKPNFTDVPPPLRKVGSNHFLFVGRLAHEKGILTLIEAQPGYHQTTRVAGAGPLAQVVDDAARKHPSLVPLGRLGKLQVREEMLSARALIFPSEWYEGFPMALVEAFACGLPVISSCLGSMIDIIDEGKTGLFFEAGNAHDLAQKMRWAALHPEAMKCMGENARRIYEQKYTPDCNYEALMEIYERAIQSARIRNAE